MLIADTQLMTYILYIVFCFGYGMFHWGYYNYILYTVTSQKFKYAVIFFPKYHVMSSNVYMPYSTERLLVQCIKNNKEQL